ncbi:MAG: hypothetical protein AAF581_21405 [Planctomycetota bacterium]
MQVEFNKPWSALSFLAGLLFLGAAAGQPANYECSGAVTVYCGSVVLGNTLNSPPDTFPSFCAGPSGVGGTLYYELVGNGDTFTVSTCNPGSSASTKLCVWKRISPGSCSLTLVDDDNGSCGNGSEVTFATVAGLEYIIRVDATTAPGGFFELSVESLLPCEAPVNPSEFIRGDANLDDSYDIGDPVAALAILFSSGATTCEAAADANDDGSFNIADAVYSLSFLFSGGPAPAMPFPTCGVDPTPDALTCDSNPVCSAAAAIHVDSVTGSDLNMGGADDPVATINQGIALATSMSIDQVLVANGTYNENLIFANGVSVRGGYYAGTWVPQPGVFSVVNSSPGGSVAENINIPTTISGLELRAAAGGVSETSSIALRVIDGNGALRFEDVSLVASDGYEGENGTPGVPGAPGAPGGQGVSGNCNNIVNPQPAQRYHVLGNNATSALRTRAVRSPP